MAERASKEGDDVSLKKVQECLKMQLEEMEMLQSMFWNAGEFCVGDHDVLADIHHFIAAPSPYLPTALDYTINLTLHEVKVEMCVRLDPLYPEIVPDIYLRSDALTREQQHDLNQELVLFLSEEARGEICVCSAVTWLQERPPLLAPLRQPQTSRSSREVVVFGRYWIYSHHIYCKSKRRELLDLAQEHNVTGFCLSGKPGIMCVEGTNLSCDQWWLRVRNMNWQRITCKKIETQKVSSMEELDALRKFPSFEEVTLTMGDFFRYLQQHKCEDIFKEYFGFSGKTSANQQVL